MALSFKSKVNFGPNPVRGALALLLGILNGELPLQKVLQVPFLLGVMPYHNVSTACLPGV